MDARAYIVFGVSLDEGVFYDEETDESYDGIGQWVAWREGDDWEDWQVSERYDEAAPVEMGWTYDGGGEYLYIRNAGFVEANDYTPSAFDPGTLRVTEEAVARARAYCDRYGIPFENPKWLLVPSHG